MSGNGPHTRIMQSKDIAIRPVPSRSGRLRKPPWRHRMGLGGRDKTRKGSLDRPWLTKTSVVLAIFIVSTGLYITSNTASEEKYETNGHLTRTILSENGTKPGWETCEYEMSNPRLSGLWVAFYFILVLIFFIAIAIICDDFFVPSLEVISETLNLSEDVAGATFMAAGSSAPELFTSVIGVAFESDVGVGTIVGSAVFNILIIIALTAALAGQVLHLDWRPLVRDSFFYALSITCFIIFSWDAYFKWWESLILLLLYVLYLVLMKVNPYIMKKTEGITCGGFCRNSVAPADPESAEPADTAVTGATEPASNNHGGADVANGNTLPRKLPPLQKPGEPDRKISVMSNASQSLTVPGTKHIFHHHKHGELSSNFRRMSFLIDGMHSHHHETSDSKTSEAGKDGEKKDGMEVEEDEPSLRPFPCLPAINMYYPDKEILDNKCGCMRYSLKWLLFLISFPFMCAFTWTIPNCNLPHLRKYYVLSFVLSIVWIAALSFAMVTVVIKAGCILGINDYTMGLVIVAIGTSVPDALSSILVARDGYGDMAVSNAIGSNVFDINLGLGLPFIIRTAVNKGGDIALFNEVNMERLHNGWYLAVPPHPKFGFILLLILALTILTFTAVRFRLNSIIGCSFAIMYFLFLIYAFVQELYCDGQC